MNETPEFQEDQPVRPTDGEEAPLLVDLEGYEGPLDVLLLLARQQKVDLTRISILDLTEQYLAFIAEARRLRLELAADYLVMAAWLAYLKSRLLLPDVEPDDDEPTGAELASRLAYQLQRLEAMRGAAQRLLARDRLGQQIFARGEPEGVTVLNRPVYDLSLFELLQAYADHQVRRAAVQPLQIGRLDLVSIEEAVRRISAILGEIPDWSALDSLLPPSLVDDHTRRTVQASTFAATLELARQGKLELRQGRAFDTIYLKSTRN